MSGPRRSATQERRRSGPRPDLIPTKEPYRLRLLVRLAWIKVRLLFFGPGMPSELQISIGQHSDRGRKEINQDFHGVLVPNEPLLSLKGIAVVLADGISSSNVSQVASESAVKSFLTDYYCTSESWSVKTSAQRVLAATNSWLHAQTRRSQYSYDKDKGYVCTLSAMVIKSTTAHIFHVGDARIYRLAGNALEQLTEDHRVVISSEQSYLGRALGVNPQIEIDYLSPPGREGRCLCAGDRRRLRIRRGPLRRRRDQGQRQRSGSGRKVNRGGGLATGKPGQSHRPDRPRRSIAGRRGRRGSRANLAIAAASAAGSAGWYSMDTESSGSFTAAVEATSIWRSIPRPTLWSRSKFRRSICVTTPPI